MIKRINYLFKHNEFVKHFAVFFTGTLLAQIATIIASPILTRVYSPALFGTFGFFTASITLLIPLVTGRYEFAINTVNDKESTFFLYKTVFYFSLFASAFLFLILLLFNKQIVHLFNLDDLYLLFFIPLTLFFYGNLQGSTYVLNKEKEFNILSKSKIYKAIATAIISIVSCYFIFKTYGLIIGYLVGIIVVLIFQRLKLKHYFKDLHPIINIKVGVVESIKKFKHYPIFNAPSALFDALAGQIPLFVMMKIYGHDVVGHYNLTILVITGPLGLIAISMSQVFFSQISHLNREGKKFKNLTIKIVKILSLFGCIPILILVFWGPQLFSFVFGAKWAISGEFARYVALGSFFGFVVSPLSMVFFIKQKVRTLSVIQTIRAITTFTLFMIIPKYFDIKGVLVTYTIHESIFYSIYLYFILKISD